MRYAVLAMFGLIAVSVGVFGLATSASADDQTVSVGNTFFCSSAQSGQVCETDVSSGDTVTWVVAAGAHTVTQCTDSSFESCGSGFNSGQLGTGGNFAQTFSTAGTFYYHCEFHPDQMKGQVVVAAAATATPTPAPTSPGSTAAPTTASTARPSSAPSTGGPLGDDAGMTWAYLLLALGGIAIGGSTVAFTVSRRRL